MKPITLNDEGLYLCSVLSGLHGRMISESYYPVTQPMLTYIYVYNEQRPALTISLVKDITRIYIQFLVGTLFQFLNKQTAECKPLVKETQVIKSSMLVEFADKLHQVRTRALTWIDFVNLFLGIFGVLCTLIFIYLWRETDNLLALRIRELERVSRV